MKTFDMSEMILNRIIAINTICLADGKTVTRNDRSTYALAMKIAGRTSYTCNNKRYVSDVNNMLLINKNTRYTWSIEEHGKCIMIEFDGKFADCDFDFVDFTLPDMVAQEVSGLFISIANLWNIKKENYMLKCKSMFYRILDKATQSEKQSYLPSDYRHRLEPVINYIHVNYADKDITNETLAAIAGMSTVYFRKMFTKVYSVSPIKYLRKLRIKKATELLIGDVASISDIADMAGYGSVYNFSKMFKSETGVSPSQYAKTYSNRTL